MDEFKYLEELMERIPVLKQTEQELRAFYQILRASYENGGKLLIAGNGGSCADADHIVGELMKGFVKKRPISDETGAKLKSIDPERGKRMADCLQQGLPAMALTGHPALSTAFSNDVDAGMVYAQQVLGFGKQGDVLLGITTSGNSENIICAAVAAKAKGMKVLGLTGRDGGKLKGLCDVAVIVPEEETYRIQELHLPVYHTICLMLEEYFF